MLLGLLLVALSPAAVRADASDPEACLRDDLCRAQYTLARELSRSGNLDEALAAYETAYQRRPVPILLYNIGRLHHRLHHYADAVRYYSRYLETQAQEEAEQRARARQYLEEATKELQPGPAPPREPSPEPLPSPGGSPQPTASPSPAPTAAPVAASAQPAVRKTAEPLARSVTTEPAGAAAEKERTPLYKRWWLWAIVGGVVVAGAVGIGLGVGLSGSQPAAPGAMSLPPGLHTYEPTF
ncbi:MAG: tetratricopeptide repeat protein [Polyangia bacterium]